MFAAADELDLFLYRGRVDTHCRRSGRIRAVARLLGTVSREHSECVHASA
jgi:hypothetical protein